MRVVTTPRVGREFDSFLYASVGDDSNGMPLTVLSALARMDVDPWEEAANLMQLPQGVAVEHLGSLLGGLRNLSVANLDPSHIAVPLVALLPRRVERARPPPSIRALAQATPPKAPAMVTTVVCVLTYVIFMLFSNWMMANIQSPRPNQTQSAETSAPTPDAQATPATREAN
jgi:hypothetical protein